MIIPPDEMFHQCFVSLLKGATLGKNRRFNKFRCCVPTTAVSYQGVSRLYQGQTVIDEIWWAFLIHDHFAVPAVGCWDLGCKGPRYAQNYSLGTCAPAMIQRCWWFRAAVAEIEVFPAFCLCCPQAVSKKMMADRVVAQMWSAKLLLKGVLSDVKNPNVARVELQLRELSRWQNACRTDIKHIWYCNVCPQR